MTQLATLPLPVVALASPTFPDPDTCWQAVQRRDRAFNGRFWFSVKSTGVYCLPSCAARPPLRKNVAFHASPAAAEALLKSEVARWTPIVARLNIKPS